LGRTKPPAFWQPRYYDFNVFRQRKYVEKLRYIHRNLVKRGVVPSPELWRWSSFRDYYLGERGKVKIGN
jgi:putative transposase